MISFKEALNLIQSHMKSIRTLGVQRIGCFDNSLVKNTGTGVILLVSFDDGQKSTENINRVISYLQDLFKEREVNLVVTNNPDRQSREQIVLSVN